MILKSEIFEFKGDDAIDLSEDITSEWLSIDPHPNRFNHAEFIFDWSGVTTETKDGVVYIESTLYRDNLDEDGELPEGTPIVIENQFDIDAANSTGDAIAITIDNGYKRRIRFRYVNNTIDAGTMKVLVELIYKD